MGNEGIEELAIAETIEEGREWTEARREDAENALEVTETNRERAVAWAAERTRETADEASERAERFREPVAEIAREAGESTSEGINDVGEFAVDVIGEGADLLQLGANWISNRVIDSLDVMGDICNFFCNVAAFATFDREASEQFCQSNICERTIRCAEYATRTVTRYISKRIEDTERFYKGKIRKSVDCADRGVTQLTENIFDPETTLQNCLEWGQCILVSELEKPLMCGVLDFATTAMEYGLNVFNVFNGGAPVNYEPARDQLSDFACTASQVVFGAIGENVK